MHGPLPPPCTLRPLALLALPALPALTVGPAVRLRGCAAARLHGCVAARLRSARQAAATRSKHVGRLRNRVESADVDAVEVTEALRQPRDLQ